MRAILVDPANRSITEVEYDGDFRDIQRLIGADPFDVRPLGGTQDVVYFDDEFLLRDGAENLRTYVWFEGLPDPIGGKCLILGSHYGESRDCTLSVDEVEGLIRGYQDMKLVGWTTMKTEKEGDFNIIRGPRPIFEPAPMYEFHKRTVAEIVSDDPKKDGFYDHQLRDFIQTLMERMDDKERDSRH